MASPSTLPNCLHRNNLLFNYFFMIVNPKRFPAKAFFLAFACLILTTCAFCQKDKALSFAKMGYNKPGLFVYKVTQTDKNNKEFRTDTLGLFCTAQPTFGEQTVMQWQYLAKGKNGDMEIPKNQYNNSFTGIGVDDTSLFIHPAREHFRVLQFCPYPFIQNNKKIGEPWTWEFIVGQHWAAPPLYPVKGNDTFHITYSITNTLLLDTKFGKLFCYRVAGTSLSKFGKSTAEYFVNNEFGIVDFSVTVVNNQSFRFTLIEKKKGMEALKINEEITFYAKKGEAEKQRKSTEQTMQYIGAPTLNAPNDRNIK